MESQISQQAIYPYEERLREDGVVVFSVSDNKWFRSETPVSENQIEAVTEEIGFIAPATSRIIMDRAFKTRKEDVPPRDIHSFIVPGDKVNTKSALQLMTKFRSYLLTADIPDHLKLQELDNLDKAGNQTGHKAWWFLPPRRNYFHVPDCSKPPTDKEIDAIIKFMLLDLPPARQVVNPSAPLLTNLGYPFGIGGTSPLYLPNAIMQVALSRLGVENGLASVHDFIRNSSESSVGYSSPLSYNELSRPKFGKNFSANYYGNDDNITASTEDKGRVTDMRGVYSGAGVINIGNRTAQNYVALALENDPSTSSSSILEMNLKIQQWLRREDVTGKSGDLKRFDLSTDSNFLDMYKKYSLAVLHHYKVPKKLISFYSDCSDYIMTSPILATSYLDGNLGMYYTTKACVKSGDFDTSTKGTSINKFRYLIATSRAYYDGDIDSCLKDFGVKYWAKFKGDDYIKFTPHEWDDEPYTQANLELGYTIDPLDGVALLMTAFEKGLAPYGFISRLLMQLFFREKPPIGYFTEIFGAYSRLSKCKGNPLFVVANKMLVDLDYRLGWDFVSHEVNKPEFVQGLISEVSTVTGGYDWARDFIRGHFGGSGEEAFAAHSERDILLDSIVSKLQSSITLSGLELNTFSLKLSTDNLEKKTSKLFYHLVDDIGRLKSSDNPSKIGFQVSPQLIMASQALWNAPLFFK